MTKRFLPAFLAFVFIFTSVPAMAQLEGHDSAPGESCADLSVGATRMNASADQDGAQILLICDGNVWQSAGAVGGGGLNGMIAAFESDTCPAGWTEYTAARGRMLVGTGTLGGETYNPADTGGEAFHTLTIAEMPAHNHSVDPPSTNTNSAGAHNHRTGYHREGYGFSGSANGMTTVGPGGSGNPVAYFSTTNGNHAHSVNIPAFNSANRGGGGAHENRPPYVAVIFCEYTGSGGGGGGAETLASLTDVDVSGATEGQSLVFVGGTWTAQSGVADNLGDHKATKDLNMATFGIANLADPLSAQDAATKAYVDDLTGENESDPQVAATTNGKRCQGDGSAVTCNLNPPSCVRRNSAPGHLVSVSCHPSEIMTGGGCTAPPGSSYYLTGSFPATDSAWSCGSNHTTQTRAYAVCCKF
ncbi:MAG: hypothetical protein A49_04140 [Methyloceanibacter sp.]|nr:MAG: hypothetical protein A49_04140 [Methyloceanibacter sp.]